MKNEFKSMQSTEIRTKYSYTTKYRLTYTVLVSTQKLVLDQNNPTEHSKSTKSWEALTTKCKAYMNNTCDRVHCPVHAWQMIPSITNEKKGTEHMRSNQIQAEMAWRIIVALLWSENRKMCMGGREGAKLIHGAYTSLSAKKFKLNQYSVSYTSSLHSALAFNWC